MEVVNPNVWEMFTAERMPDYEYAGVTYPGGVVSFGEGYPIAFDLWENGYDDIVVSMNKGYASGIDTRMPILVFRNDQGLFRESSDELVGGVPSIAGLRRMVALASPTDTVTGVFGVAHDTGDGMLADAVLIASGPAPSVETDRLPQLPHFEETGRPHAVNAHALAAGDVTGNGLTDILVGELFTPPGSYWLLQGHDGSWTYKEDDFLTAITSFHPMENEHAGEGFNLLLDLHLADLNGNGVADLVAGWGHGSTRSVVFFNDGAGTFSYDNSAPLPLSVYGLDNTLHMRTFSLDVTTNGHLDLLIVQSRYEPYYGGNAMQLLINDGSGTFQDHTSTRLISLEGRDTVYADRLEWSDNFYLLDINGDGILDIIGNDGAGVRLWIGSSSGVFTEVPVVSHGDLNARHIFISLGDGSVGSLVFRQSWTDAEGTENRVWFEQHVLRLPHP